MKALCEKFLIKLIRVYQYWSVGFGIHGACRFPHQSCSHFAISAFQQKGPLKGMGLILLRLLACQPWIRVPWERKIHTLDISSQKQSQ